MTVVVTGAAGFIGAHVARALLDRGDHVVGIDNMNAYYDPRLKEDRLSQLIGPAGGFRFLAGDFSEQAVVSKALEGERPRAIVHLGAQAGVRYSLEAPRDYARSNLAGHLEMLELARHAKVAHLVYASSSSVYGDTSQLPFSAEGRADRPVSFYAATKRSNELMSESYAHLYRVPMTGLRFFTVYGPWGRPDMAIWRFTERVLKGDALPVYNGGEMKRDFTYIDDIVAGVIAALDRPPADDHAVKPGGSLSPHAVYNLGNDRPEELGKLISLICEACGREPKLNMLPMQPGDVTATWADIGPARSLLGYDPATPLAEGVPRFVEWFRAWTKK